MEERKNYKNSRNDLGERLLDFAAKVIKLINMLPKTVVGNYIGKQLMRSGASAGSNYEEACGAESRADFIHKLGIALKELKESRFWLMLIDRVKLVSFRHVELLLQECRELCAIVAQSILTARKKRKKF